MTNHDIIRASDWVTVSDIAKRAGVSRQAIHQAISASRLRTIKFGTRSVLVNRRDAEAYIQSRQTKKAG
jgi:excisionase family DNA binding protein